MKKSISIIVLLLCIYINYGCKDDIVDPPDPIPPVAKIDVSATSGEAPLTVTFNDISTGEINSRLWKFSDGSTSSSSLVTKTYSRGGSYSVTLEVTGPGGSNSTAQTINVSQSLIPTPSPLSPIANQQLPNGCEVTPHPFIWNFNWSGCPGATEYNIIIGHPNISVYKNEIILNTTSYSFQPPQPFSSPDYYDNWYWKIRAKINGVWGEFSTQASFKVEPINSGCQTGFRLYQHPNYSGDSRYFIGDTPDLDLGTINFADVASSIRIYNIAKVRCYDGKNYTGAMLEVTGDMPDLRNNNFNDRIGSIDFYPFR